MPITQKNKAARPHNTLWKRDLLAFARKMDNQLDKDLDEMLRQFPSPVSERGFAVITDDNAHAWTFELWAMLGRAHEAAHQLRLQMEALGGKTARRRQ
jgi:hypothetical protein